jgi:D-arabinose 1-dehydrogenase-like Zn-dependent alcohol dehydrogenase
MVSLPACQPSRLHFLRAYTAVACVEIKCRFHGSIIICFRTTGIGLATAQDLGAEGAKVIVTGRNPETLASAKKILSDSVVLRSEDSSNITGRQLIIDGGVRLN